MWVDYKSVDDGYSSLVNFQLRIMIFQLSDWFPKPGYELLLLSLTKINKEKLMANFLCCNFGGQKKFFRGVVGKENVTI